MKYQRHLLRGGAVAFGLCVAFAAAGEFGGASRADGRDKSLQKAEKALKAGEFEEAEKLFREILAREKRDSEARLGLSRALLKQRKYQDAFDHAARVLADDPTSYRAHSLIGAALLGAGDFQVSVEEFRTALQFKDDDAMAVAGLGMVDFYENRLSSSLARLRRAAFIDADEPDYQFNLGQVAARSERYEEAANAYERFLRVAPRNDTDRRERIRGLIEFLHYLGTQNTLMRTEGTSRGVVPFDLVNNRPIVNVRVNGAKETMRFVIDTGAGMCVLSTRAADRIGLHPVARGGYGRAIGGGGRFEIVYGFLQSLHIGEARVERVPVYIREFFNAQEPVDGYIGLSLLSKYVTTVDYGTHEMQMLRGDAVPEYKQGETPPGVAIPIRVTSSGFWSGEVSFEGLEKPVNFIIDTGASISVVARAHAERAGFLRYQQPVRIRVYGAAGLAEDVPTISLPSIRFGPHTHRDVTAAVLEMDPINETSGFEQAGIVGGNILRNFRDTFDFSRAVVRLEPLVYLPRDEGRTGEQVLAPQP